MNGKRAKRQNADERKEARRRRAEKLRKAEECRRSFAELGEPRFVGAYGPDFEAWVRNPEGREKGEVMFVIPAIREDDPPQLKAAIDRRRRASLYGVCDCGDGTAGDVWVDDAGQPHVPHWLEHDCPAGDDELERLLARLRGAA